MTNPTPKKSLRDLITTTEKTVVLSDGSKIILSVKKQTTGEQKALLQRFPNMSDPTHPQAIDAGIEVAVGQVKSWEFEEEINVENFLLLPADDVKKIVDVINGKDVEEKKD